MSALEQADTSGFHRFANLAKTMDFSYLHVMPDKLARLHSLSQVCRICAAITDKLHNLFHKDGLKHELVDKINKYLPIKVEKDDQLPQSICANCREALLAWDELGGQARIADIVLRRRLRTLQPDQHQAAEECEFMLCRFEEQDPRKCINEGKAVTACTMDFFRKVKKSCLAEFNQYSNCLDKSSGDYSFEHCRKTQGVFDKCMLENLNLERPPFGYFTEVRVHDSKRPKPIEEPKAIYPDATPALPENAEKKPARFGSRFYWMTE